MCQPLVVCDHKLGRCMITDTHNSCILPWVSIAFVQMQQDMTIDILWGLWLARGKVICCCTMMFDTHRHMWASWAKIMAGVDTLVEARCVSVRNDSINGICWQFCLKITCQRFINKFLVFIGCLFHVYKCLLMFLVETSMFIA